MIIDTHTHFYDPSRPQGVPWPRPTEKVLYRTVLPDEYAAMTAAEGVSGTVVVEASPWVADNQWILDLAVHHPTIVGFVGNLDPRSAAFGADLAHFAANPLYRGIRIGGAALDPADERVLASLADLAARDLVVDLLVGPERLTAVAELAARLPDLRLVIDHVGSARIDGRPPDPVWAEGMAAAAQDNVYCKVSGLVENTRLKPPPEDLATYRPVLDHLWAVFGQDRLIYGSNWPVCELYAAYATVQRLAQAYFDAKGAEASQRYFEGNSRAVYKWVAR